MLTPFLVTSFALLLQAPAPAAPSATLKYETPPGWTSKALSSSMRLADFALPKVEGDSEDATLTVYHFPGGGGGVEANLDRWVNQMTQPDSRPSKELSKTTTLKSNELSLTIIDLPGTYIAEKSPGSTERFNKPGFHLRAAVIEGKGGPYYVKVIGPEKTVAKWEASVQAFLKSLRVE